MRDASDRASRSFSILKRPGKAVLHGHKQKPLLGLLMKKMLSHHTDLAPPLKVLSSSPGQDMPSVMAGHILWELTVQILESNKLLSNVRSTKGFTSLSLSSFLFLMSKYVTLIFFTFL